jgi:hypothetical protein
MRLRRPRDKTQGETSMTITIPNKTMRSKRFQSGLQRLCSSLGNAIDTYAEYRMRNAVSYWEGRRADHELSRFRTMLNVR